MKRILIIEQDPEMVKYLNLVASHYGFRGEVASSVEEAERRLMRGGDYCLVLLSCSVYGDEFVSRWASVVQQFAPSRILVIGSEDGQEIEHLVVQSGAMAYLTIPFEVVFIPDMIEEFCEKEGLREGSGEGGTSRFDSCDSVSHAGSGVSV